MTTRTNQRTIVSHTFFILIVLCLACLVSPVLNAQPTDPPPRLSLYGFDDDEFIIGIMGTKWALLDTANHHTKRPSLMWPFVDALGGNLYWVNGKSWEIDTIYNSPVRVDGEHRFRTPASGRVYGAGFARGIRFFPFDSLQLKVRGEVDLAERGWYFFSTPGGARDTNTFHGLSEKLYTNLADTGLIASGIVFYSTDTLSERSSAAIKRCHHWFQWRQRPASLLPEGSPDTYYPETYYITLMGHLDFLQDPDTVELFRVAIYHEIPPFQEYLDDSMDVVSNGATKREVLVDSFAVYDTAFYDADQFDRLSEHSTPVDLRYRFGNTNLPGPRHPDQPEWDKEDDNSQTSSFDIRVYWTGQKAVALHAVELRDSVGEMILGTTAQSDDMRDYIMHDAKRFLYGDTAGIIDSLRVDITALECSTEPGLIPYEFAGFQAVNEMLRNEFNLPDYRVANGQSADPKQGDSIGVAQFDQLSPHTIYRTGQDRIHTEFYWNILRDTVAQFSWWKPGLLDQEYLELPLHQIPRLKQRNGGRFHLPELLDLDSVGIPSYDNSLSDRIDTYDEMVQRIQFGRYDPGNQEFYFDTVRQPDWPHVLRPALYGMVNFMAESAITSRETGKPWVPLPGVVTHFQVRDHLNTEADPDVYTYDTISSPNPTESELFGTVGMLLGYGARGIMWYTMISEPRAGASSLKSGEYVSIGAVSSWGSNGYYASDTVHNVYRPFELKDDHPFYGPARISVPAFYVGWRDGTRAVKKINAWVKRIGPELLKLRWREGYSMHFTVPWTGKQIDTVFRPLDSEEIISGIRTRSLFSTSWDPAHRTFIEANFFDPLIDSTNGLPDPLKTKHHLFLTNRRTFRKPADTCWFTGYCDRDTVIDGETVTVYDFDESVTILDTLAGTRLVEVKLNVDHPDTTTYNFWRVREIEPDYEPLPHQPGVNRWTLDTIVYADSAFHVVLGPGRSTLLEISPTYPDSSLIAGVLRFPGQKKLMFDGKRYHAILHKERTLPGVGTDNVVIWRISLPLTQSTGAIRWLNDDIVLSDPLVTGDTMRTDNRFASMTLRRFGDTIRLHSVWTAHPAQLSPPGDREVLARNMTLLEQGTGNPNNPSSFTLLFSPLHTIDWHDGTDAVQWGTPVVATTDGATVFAWSDSAIGIVGRLYPFSPTNYNWPSFSPTLSARDSISWIGTQTTGFSGKYPSMPPYTRLHAADSTIGITWRQPNVIDSDVMINRLQHTAADALVNVNAAGASISPWNGLRFFPSMDLNQDTSSSLIDEGVTWEDDFLSYKAIYFQALRTDPASQVTTQTARSGLIVLEDDTVTTWPYGVLYPQGASIGEHDTSTAGADREQYAIAFSKPAGFEQELWLSLLYWDSATFHGSWPKQYAYAGYYPNTLYDPTRTWSNNGIMYETDSGTGSGSTVRTSRQFFAKAARPTGYVAQGRATWFRQDDSAGSGYHIQLYDPWQVTDIGGSGLALVERTTESADVDTLSNLESLFRTGYFDIDDTVTIGFRLDAMFTGDSSAASGSRIDCIVELVDSASGMVVEMLDSVRVSPQSDSIRIGAEVVTVESAGTYYLRMRLDTAGLTVAEVDHDARYPVWEVAGYVQNPPAAKRAGSEAVAGESGAVVAVRPNPVSGTTRVVVALRKAASVKVNLLDPTGAIVRRIRETEMLKPGAHHFDFDASGIPSGSYLLEARIGDDRVMQQIVVLR